MKKLQPFHLAFPVHDLSEAKEFYTKILGYTLGRSSEHWIDFNLFGHQIVAHLSDENYIKNLGIRGPVPSYDVINASIVFNASDKLSISLIGKNITDEVYIGSRLHSNPSQTEAGMSSGIIPGPRRQINFGINYKF